MDLESIRRRLVEGEGPQYWRSLDELAQTEEFRQLVRRRFGVPVSPQWNAVTRRRFLGLMAASLGLAGVVGCRPEPPGQTIVPYVRMPEEIVPGKPLFFATAVTLGGLARGVVVESHEGRPTKIEGNQFHPASLGATDPFAQAAVLGLYDPDRSATVMFRGQPSTWANFVTEIRGAIARLSGERGAAGVRIRLLSETVTSPTLIAQIRGLLRQFPSARWHQYEPASGEAIREGLRIAFGRPVHATYRFDQAARVLSLDADFLGPAGGEIRYARDFMARRRQGIAAAAGSPEMNRLYVVESQMSPTGAKADHRWPLRASQVEAFARAVAGRLEDPQGHFRGLAGSMPVEVANGEQVAAAIARDLSRHRGQSLVLAGREQPPAVHALAHAMNAALGNVNKTVHYLVAPDAVEGVEIRALGTLVEEMHRGDVDLLVVLGGNPVYSAPADLDFAQALLAKDDEGRARVPLRVHLGLYQDETAFLCDWHVAEAHGLEMWSDARATDGTACIIQPLIAPLYGGRSAHEIVATLAGTAERSPYELVRQTWREFWQRQFAGKAGSKSGPASADPAKDFDVYWRTALHQGVLEGTALPPQDVSLHDGWIDAVKSAHAAHAGAAGVEGEDRGLEIVFRPDPAVYDGRFANNAWLQELPKPLTRLTWGNAAILSPATAAQYGLTRRPAARGGEHGQIVVDGIAIAYRGRTLRIPVWIQPGHPDGTLTLHIGYGRTRAGQVGTAVGANANALRTSDALGFADGLIVSRAAEVFPLACTQSHQVMEGRNLVRAGTIDEFRRDPDSIAHRGEELPSLYPEFEYPDHRWAMGIDLSTCIGCNACVVACQAENNIPVVGKEEVLRGREMHWLRIDTYYEGPAENPRGHFQPVPCMHCEKAPCELVCPVEATVHSDDGLNDMIYNRCVGTRYCSNNCPYKVRRFNFFQYAGSFAGASGSSSFAAASGSDSLKLLYNPDVTVRSRGVMEKCTYCVQRIRRAEIEAGKAGRNVRDGEMVTACQAACPTHAIAFGDWNDPASEVRRWKESPLNYGLLAELNTQPRTTYLAAVRNPNPELG